MKRYITLTALLAICTALSGQPVVSEFWVPEIGDQWDQAATETIPHHGPGGADITWDFGEVDSSGFIGSFGFEWIDTTGTPYIDSFPEANICARFGVGGFATYNYYQHDDDGFHYWGNGSQFETQVFYDRQTFNYIGLEYGQAAVDTYGLIVHNSFSDPDSTLGLSSFTYDGYGTLILPYTTIDDAIRLHELDVRYDSTNSFGFITVVWDTLETYAWIAEGSVFPVAQWQRSVVRTRNIINGEVLDDNIDGPDTIFAYNPDYMGTTSLSRIDNRPSLEAYPSVTKDLISVKGILSDQMDYRIYSMNGQPIHSGKFDGHTIDVAHLKSGMYVLVFGQFRPFLFVKQ